MVGWSELQQERTKQAWERERWAVWVLASIQLERKDRQAMTDMFPLPWEASTKPPAVELTDEQRRERVNEILKSMKNEP